MFIGVSKNEAAWIGSMKEKWTSCEYNHSADTSYCDSLAPNFDLAAPTISI